MKKEEVINLVSTDADVAKVKAIIQKSHKQGLDVKKAEELGVFRRISYLTCAISTLNYTAFRLYTEVDNLFDAVGSNRHEVKRELDAVYKAFDRFIKFFRGYQSMDGVKEMNEETESFYHQFMRWCNLPEQWELGSNQLTEPETDPLILISNEDKELRFYRSILESEDLSEESVEYCVTKYNPATSTQETVEDKGLDKSYAQMVAKRYSANDQKGIYTASKLVTKDQRITEIYPLKAYENGELVGSYKKIIR